MRELFEPLRVGALERPKRLRLDAPWNEPDPSTYYSGGDQGYIDYPFLAR